MLTWWFWHRTPNQHPDISNQRIEIWSLDDETGLQFQPPPPHSNRYFVLLTGKCVRAQCKFYHYPPQDGELTQHPGYHGMPCYDPEVMTSTGPISTPVAVSPMTQNTALYPQVTHYITSDGQVGLGQWASILNAPGQSRLHLHKYLRCASLPSSDNATRFYPTHGGRFVNELSNNMTLVY